MLRYKSAMLISAEALDEFIAIYKEEFGEEIDRVEATEMAHRLLNLFRLLEKKLPEGTKTASSTLPDDEQGRLPIGFRT
jgi:hypothetical protein